MESFDYKNRIKDRKAFLELTILCAAISLSVIFLFWGPELMGGVIAMAILVLVAFRLTKMELLHPMTWFPPIFFMYSVSMPILVMAGEEPKTPGLEYTLFIEWLALASFILFMGRVRKYDKVFKVETLSNVKILAVPIFVASLLFSTVYLAYIFRNGLNSKYAISLDGSIFSSLNLFFSIFVLSFLLLFTYKLTRNKRIPKLLLLFSVSFALIILMVAGERDIILRVILGSVILIHFLHKPFKKTHIFAFGVLGIFSIPVLSNFKNFAFGSRSIASDTSIVSEIFGGEFRSASRNLNFLVNNPDMWSSFHGETLIWDLKIALFGNATSPGAWFNQTFFPNLVAQGGGNGFSLVGEGYMNFGIAGVLLWFAMLAFLLKYLFKKAHASLIWAVIYITLIPIIVYAIRGDFATILTHFTKHIALPLLLIYITKSILEKKPILIRKKHKRLSSR